MRLRSLAGLALHNLADNELRSWLLGLCACVSPPLQSPPCSSCTAPRRACTWPPTASVPTSSSCRAAPRRRSTGRCSWARSQRPGCRAPTSLGSPPSRGVAVASPQVYLESLSHASCCAVSHMFIVAYDPRTDFTVEPWLHQELGGELGLNKRWAAATSRCRSTTTSCSTATPCGCAASSSRPAPTWTRASLSPCRPPTPWPRARTPRPLGRSSSPRTASPR